MTGKTIPQLPNGGPLTGTEPIETVQGGASVQTTTQAIANLASSGAAALLVESGGSEKISALSAAGSLAGTEEVPVVQGGATKSTTVQAIANLATTGMSVNQIASLTYTFVIGDANTYIQFTNGSAISVTIPANASVAFAIGTTINIEQFGAGIVTFSAAGGVTLHSAGSLVATNGQYAVVAVTKVATNTWTLYGNLGA